MSKRSPNASTREWRVLRAAKLAADPWCEWQDCGAWAVEVDHVVPLKQWPGGRFVWSNLRSMCDDHHKIRHGRRPRPRVDPNSGLPTSHHWWCENEISRS
jgi:5-methylcytosine-specific restriction endonuclease McrA